MVPNIQQVPATLKVANDVRDTSSQHNSLPEDGLDGAGGTTAEVAGGVVPDVPQAALTSQYMVQLGSKRSETEALALFAIMQIKFSPLLSNYRPMVQKVDLGSMGPWYSKGTWYHLRIGPILSKETATQLCGQLKSRGHRDCLVKAMGE